MHSVLTERLDLKAESEPTQTASPSLGESNANFNGNNGNSGNVNASVQIVPTHTASASSGLQATNSNNNNVNTGNSNSILIGDNKMDGLVVHAGRDLYMSISMNQGEALPVALQLDSLKEALPESSNFDIANAEASFGLRQPYTAGVYESEAGRQHYPESVASLNARSELKTITPKNLKDHVPKTIHQRIVGYMCASKLFDSRIAIPLWNPSPSLYDSETNHIRHWRKNVYLGDVGVFNNNGGFDTYFNIFETREENESRGRKLPANFTRYHKKLSEMAIKSDSSRAVDDKLKMIGFEKVKTTESAESSTAMITIQFSPGPRNCSALHMINGFRRVQIPSSEEGGLKSYCRRQQTGWYESLEGDLEGRSLAVITTSYRAKAWASVAAKFSHKERRVKLLQMIKGKDVYSWASEDNNILTNCGPSQDHLEKIESYCQALGDESIRKETEECHAVGVEAFYLHEKSSWIGGSTRSKRTMTAAAASIFSLDSFRSVNLFRGRIHGRYYLSKPRRCSRSLDLMPVRRYNRIDPPTNPLRLLILF